MEDRKDLIEHYFNLRYEQKEILSCLQSVLAYQNRQSAIGNLDLSLCIDAFAVYALTSHWHLLDPKFSERVLQFL